MQMLNVEPRLWQHPQERSRGDEFYACCRIARTGRSHTRDWVRRRVRVRARTDSCVPACSDLKDNLADLNAQLCKECIEKDQISAGLSKSLNIRRQLEQELAAAATEVTCGTHSATGHKASKSMLLSCSQCHEQPDVQLLVLSGSSA